MHEREPRNLGDRVDEIADAAERTSEAVTGLARSLDELVARQRKTERTLNLNSFVAYAIFTLLIGAGFFLLYRARAGELGAERDRVIKARDLAQGRAHDLEAEHDRRAAVEHQAEAAYQLFVDHRYDEALAAIAKLDGLALSPTERALFARATEDARGELAALALKEGAAALKAGKPELARDRFRAGLAASDKGPRALELRYQLGLTLHRMGHEPEAQAELERALAGGAEGQGLVEARYLLAVVLEAEGKVDDARREYRAFVEASPTDGLAALAKQRLWLLARGAAPPSVPRLATPAASAVAAAAATPIAPVHPEVAASKPSPTHPAGAAAKP